MRIGFYSKGVESARAGRSGLHTLLILVCLLTFAAQSFVTATHIHGTAGHSVASGASARLDTSTTERNGVPTDPDDVLHCPFCQAILLAGAVIGTKPLALVSPHFVAEFVAPLPYLVRYHWRSVGALHNRGPPRF